MVAQYASSRRKISLDNVTVSIESGGQTTTAFSVNAYIQFENRAGRNLLSDSIPLYVPAGSKARFEFADGLIESGEEVFWIVISVENTNNILDAAIVAKIAVRLSDRVSIKSFPLNVELFKDEHFDPSPLSVSSFTALPSTDIIFGQIYLVTDEAQYYIYDEWSLNWLVYPNGRQAYLESTTSEGGCDRLLTDVDSALRVLPKVGNADTNPLRIWWLNGYEVDGLSPLEANTRFTLEFSVNGSAVSVDGKAFSTIFSNKVKATLIGYVDRATGILDTSMAQGTIIWNPVTSFLTLPQELPRGYAAVWDLVLSFENEQMLGVIGSGASIEINVVEVSENVGVPSPIAVTMGNLVFAEGGRLRILPTPLRLNGSASVGAGYLISSSKDLPFPGLLAADTDNQGITLLGSLNGFIAVRQPGEELQPDEIVRAIVSTEPGKGQAQSTSITVAANSAIAITIVHPTKIREDYPDIIAGDDRGSYTPTVGRLAIYNPSTFDYYEEDTVRSLGTGESISFTIADLTGFTSSVEHQPEDDFDLFRSESITATEVTGAGSFEGTYTIYFYAEYESPNYSITRISHDPTYPNDLESEIVSELESNLALTIDGMGNPYVRILSTGNRPTAFSDNAIGIGQSAVGLLANAIGMGNLAVAEGKDSISIGRETLSQGDSDITIGTEALSSQDYGLAIGFKAQALGNSSISLGYTSRADLEASIAIGLFALAESDNAVALGRDSWAGKLNSIAIGLSAYAGNGESAIAIGTNSEVYNNTAEPDYSIAIGHRSYVEDAVSAIALGNDAEVYADNSTAIGLNAEVAAGAINAVQLGTGANSNAGTLQFQTITLANNVGLEIAQTVTDPNGVVTARVGTLLFETTNGLLYINNDSATSWITAGSNAPANQVFEVADLTARDALTTQAIADIAKVADDGTGNPKDYVWSGTTWLAFVGSATSSFGSPFAQDIGDGTNSVLTVNHNLSSRDLFVTVYRNSAPFDEVEVGVARTDANNISLDFGATVPTTGEYRVVINNLASATSPFAQDIGDGTNSVLTVNHNLSSRDVFVTVYRNSAPFDEVEVGVARTDTNNISLDFGATVPTTGEYRVVVNS